MSSPAPLAVHPPLSDWPYRRALVVANPVSGRGRGAKAAQEVAEGLKRAGVPAELLLTARRGDAFTRLRCLEPDTDLVVSVGGDGTLREVLEGLVDPETPVLPIPFGTANVLAVELGLPRDVHHALEILRRKKLARLDVARVNDHLSFLVTGVGFDGMLVRELERRRSGAISRWHYLGALARLAPRYRPPRLTVTIDGERVPGEHGLVLVSNFGRYAGLLRLSPEARIDDGRLEVYLFPTGRWTELLAAFARGLVGHLPAGAVRLAIARRVTVSSADPVPYQVDGDTGGETPVEIEVAPNQYRLVVP